MRQRQNIEAIQALEPDYLGFIFYPQSSRYVGAHLEKEILDNIPASTKKVGVFVNESLENMVAAVQKYNLQAVQLHGDESPVVCRQLKQPELQVFKAFSIDEAFDFLQIAPYEGTCDFYLFDTKGQQFGGNGISFNWQLLEKYPFATPFFLSGGIDPEHPPQIKTLKLPALAGIDINSRFETSPAVKDTSKVKSFFEKIRNLEGRRQAYINQ
jgi:phosphoribosylanthranilate isomerase